MYRTESGSSSKNFSPFPRTRRTVSDKPSVRVYLAGFPIILATPPLSVFSTSIPQTLGSTGVTIEILVKLVSIDILLGWTMSTKFH